MLHKRILFVDSEGNNQEFCLAVGQCGKGAPTGDTPCCSGITYLDEDTCDLYKCVPDGEGGHRWEIIPCSSDIKALEDKVAKIMDELNYKAIDIIKFINSAAGTHEIGSVLDALTISWELNKDPESQTFNGTTIPAAIRGREFQSVSTAQTFTLKVTDERGATDTASSSVNFYNGVYYGVLADGADINSAALLAMTRKLQNSRAVTFTANAGTGKRHAFAIPSRYGTPTFKDAETGFQAGFYLAKTFEFTNASGYTEEYNVWLSTNPALGSMTVAVS